MSTEANNPEAPRTDEKEGPVRHIRLPSLPQTRRSTAQAAAPAPPPSDQVAQGSQIKSEVPNG